MFVNIPGFVAVCIDFSFTSFKIFSIVMRYVCFLNKTLRTKPSGTSDKYCAFKYTLRVEYILKSLLQMQCDMKITMTSIAEKSTSPLFWSLPTFIFEGYAKFQFKARQNIDR